MKNSCKYFEMINFFCLFLDGVPHTVGLIRDFPSVYRLSTIVPHERLESSSGIIFRGLCSALVWQ